MTAAAPLRTAAAHEAVLTNWVLCQHRDGICITGVIDDDGKVRFTSMLQTPAEDVREGMVIETLNNRYLLKAPASALTQGIIQMFLIWGLKPLDATMQRQLAAIISPRSYAEYIDASIVYVASVPEIMRAGEDTDEQMSDTSLVFAIGTMEAAKEILSSDMLDDAIAGAKAAMAAPAADRAAINPFINQTISPIIEKLECLARIGEDDNAIARVHFDA